MKQKRKRPFSDVQILGLSHEIKESRRAFSDSMMTYRKERDRNLLVAGRWSWMSLLGFACIKSGSALIRPDRQMFRREKKVVFPFILSGLFDPEGLGAATRLGVSPVFKSGSALLRPDRQMFSREKKAVFPFILLRLFDPEGLGAATRRPLVPQEITHLPFQSLSQHKKVL
ncbi:hypothetical protein [Rossellomorea vietnamensis]|uniref:hypothetical protein n=1 Tax=Rossellomorea vietnamensis TaxID=218284 RepID=UPI003CF3D8D0